jgi:hypothetical protein
MTTDTTVQVNRCIAMAFSHVYWVEVAGSQDSDERYDRVVAYYHGSAVEGGVASMVQGTEGPDATSGFLVPVTDVERHTFSKELGDDPYDYFFLFFEDGGWQGLALYNEELGLPAFQKAIRL